MDFIFGYCCYNLIFIACEVDGFDATGFPEPKIRWEKSGIHLCGTKELNISSSNTHDAGEYVCIASNGVRQEKTVRAYVTVQFKSNVNVNIFGSTSVLWKGNYPSS